MTTETIRGKRGFRGGYILPLVVLAIMGGFFLVALESGDPSRLPSALIGRKVPEFALPPVEGLNGQNNAPMPGLASADLAKGEVSIVNIWASWCGPCVQEHPALTSLKTEHGLRLVGINYKDEAGGARRFLAKLGNPFDAIGADLSGRTGIDWGVYGVPETFVVDGNGAIVYKFVGPLSEDAIAKQILPAVAKARKTPLPGGES
jgi:cytochrome c biogenesis protein CcmG/thiol:disulfide interchange protein DsbE